MSNEATGPDVVSTPVIPRPASTVLIVRDDPFEVLLVLRSTGHDFYPSVYVFPGGRVEEEDGHEGWLDSIDPRDLPPAERAHRIAAVRETHEEAAILLADGLVPALADGRPDGESGVHVAVPPRVNGAAAFRELVSSLGARLLLDEVVPFAHWITPPGGPKRFDTRFYLTRAPEGQLAEADATETDDTVWMNPAEAVELARQGSLALPSPTWMNLYLLSQSQDSEEAIAKSRARDVVPVMTTTPPGEPKGPGWSRLQLPLEAGYGGTIFDVPGR